MTSTWKLETKKSVQNQLAAKVPKLPAHAEFAMCLVKHAGFCWCFHCEKSRLRVSVHKQDGRNHEDINCPGEHSRQNQMRAPMKEESGFRRCLYFILLWYFWPSVYSLWLCYALLWYGKSIWSTLWLYFKIIG